MVGLNRPVPTMATSRPGRNSHHDEPTATIVSSAWPAAMSARPAETSTRGETFWPTDAVAPATKKLSIVPGTYTRPASMADSPRICWRYSVM